MEPSSALDLISKDKIHHFFAFLPLLTMVLLNANIWILITYTFFFAIFEVYFALFFSFSKLVAKESIDLFNKDKELRLKGIWKYLKDKFWFVDNLVLPSVAMIIVILSYIVTFILSIIYLKLEYMNFVLLAHIFLGIFMWRLIKIIRHLSTDKRVREAFKNGKTKNN